MHPSARVFISGSGLQFRDADLPIKTDPFENGDAYSVQPYPVCIRCRYYRTLGIRAYVGYFSITTVRAEPPNVAKMIANAVKILLGQEEIIEIGDMPVKGMGVCRRYCAEAIWTLVQQDAVTELP